VKRNMEPWTSYHTIATKTRRLLQNKYTETCEDHSCNDFPNIMRLPPCIEVLHPCQQEKHIKGPVIHLIIRNEAHSRSDR